MRAVVCDCCRKLLGENEVIYVRVESSRAEVCEECEKKVRKINDSYDKAYNKIQEQYKKEQEKYKEQLKNIGLKFWEE